MQDTKEFDPKIVPPPSDISSEELVQIVLKSINGEFEDDHEEFINDHHEHIAKEKGAA
jgi:hypothetical protein